MSNNKRIPELPAISTANIAQLFAVYDPGSDVTYRVSLQQIINASGFIPDQWAPGVEYTEGAIVSHDYGLGQQVWVAVNSNTDSEPTDTNADWRLATASDLNLKSYDGTSSTLVFNANSSIEAIFKTSDVDGDRICSIINLENLLRLTIFFTLTGSGTWNQDFSGVSPSIISSSGNWDSVSKQWQPIQAGKYKLLFEFDGEDFHLSISNLTA